MQDLVGHEESSADRYGPQESQKMTWDDYVDAKFRDIEADPTVLIIGGGQSGLMCAARLGKLGIRALIIERNARIGNSWRQRYPNLTLHTPAYLNSMLYSPYPTNFPKYIPKGKLANFLESYAVNQELCIWLSSTIAPNPVYDSFSARWTVEVEHGNCKVILHPKHLVFATGDGRPRIPTWNGMDDFQGTLYHSNFHRDAEQFRGKRVVVVGAGNASGDIGKDFIAHGAAEVTIVQRSATCVVSLTAAEKSFFDLPLSDKTPIEELDFRDNSMPLAFRLQLMKSGGTQYLKMLDKELHEGLRKAGFNLTWEYSPGSGEVGLLGFLLERSGSGTMLDTGYGKLIVEGIVKVKQGQDISHFDQEGIAFKDGSKLSADVIVLATGNEPIMNTIRALLGDTITEQLPPMVMGLDAEGEFNQSSIMASDNLQPEVLSANWLKSLEVASSTGDTASFVNHFLSDGWLRGRTLSGQEKIHEFLSEVVDGQSRLGYSNLHDFKPDDHSINAPSTFKGPGLQGIEGVKGAFTFSITKPAAHGRGFFRLMQDVDGSWKALTLFTNMEDLVGHEESTVDRYGPHESQKMTWDNYLDEKFRNIEADPTVLIVGGGQNGLMCAARLGKLGIRALVIERNARVGDSWRQRCFRQFKGIAYLSDSRTNFPKYIPKGKLANFLESYAVNQELCIWLSSTVAPNPVYDSFSARWTVEVERGNCKVILRPKHLVFATGDGRPRIPTWNGMDDFQGTLYHSDFHRDAEQFRGKRVVVVGAGNASGDICEDFVAHGAAEVTIVQRSATCHVSLTAAEKSFFDLPFSDKTPIEEVDFRDNSAPFAFRLQLMKSGGTQYLKMLDKELHEVARLDS
ncbi:hypothetical protein AZE42_07269 [Rhizopogon vesiculosus]|uniref:FAD/NAD(P)-binding domain-containing protein n=1 Tax=Rhizopogon vesiculosus TaxID=180088 RepID=A0A1J8QBP4_9AGAM|nr:hypothetical protein AZE42_07269 [Rhizopogon vesiculosus]